jgi:hypothetical protein
LLATVLFETTEKVVCVVGRVVVDNIWGVVRVNLINVFAELASRFGLDFLDLLETTGLHKCALSFELEGKDLSELSANVGQDVVGSQLEEGLKSGNVGAHLDNVLKSLLRLILEVLAGLLEHVDGEETGGNISLSEVLGVVGGVTTDLTKGPGGSSLKVILRLIDKGVLERSNTLANNNSHSEGIVEGRDVTEGHDTGETGVSLGLADVVNG